MLLWMIIQESAYEKLMAEGVYRLTDAADTDQKYFPWAYEWINEKMTERAGAVPEGVVAPVTAWLR